jgi:YVTN family beta-propeller protein
MRKLAALALLGLGLLASSPEQATEQPPLLLGAKVPLGKVRGRIDHLAVDLGRQRLFVAEFGNNSVGVIDLKERKLITNIAGLEAPQGVGYEASTDTLYVANAMIARNPPSVSCAPNIPEPATKVSAPACAIAPMFSTFTPPSTSSQIGWRLSP